jgi:hypothetical protein
MVDETKLTAIRPWIEEQLKPISEADSGPLADYVVALLKHDLSANELRKMCEEQLQEFLHDNTTSFLENLMHVVEFGVPKNEPEPNQFGGQEQFRRNFRNGARDYMGGEEYVPRAPVGYSMPQTQWSNGVPLLQVPAMPIPNSQGYIPPFNFAASPMFQFSQGGFRSRGGRGGRQGSVRRGSRSDISDHSARQVSLTAKILVVEKIPSDKFHEESLREYFSRFGTLTRVKLNNSLQVAELEFETHAQALAAYQSPDSIFGNRLVKVY